MLAPNDDEDQLFEAIKAGAARHVLKDIDPTDLIAIIRRVRSGEYLINDKVFSKPAVASRVLKEFRELAVYGADAQPIFAPLSPREVEILDNIAQGMTNKQVAYALSISEQTVKNHMSLILRKLSGQRPHPGRRLRDAPGLDQDPRGLSLRRSEASGGHPGAGTEAPWPGPRRPRSLSPRCPRYLGNVHPNRGRSGSRAGSSLGSPPPVREPCRSRHGSLTLSGATYHRSR